MLNFFYHIQTGFILSKQSFALDYKIAREMGVAKIFTWAHFKIQTWIKSWGWAVEKRFTWADLHLACFLLQERWGRFLGRDRCLGRVFWCLPNPPLSGPGGVISKRLSFLQQLVTKYGWSHWCFLPNPQRCHRTAIKAWYTWEPPERARGWT